MKPTWLRSWALCDPRAVVHADQFAGRSSAGQQLDFVRGHAVVAGQKRAEFPVRLTILGGCLDTDFECAVGHDTGDFAARAAGDYFDFKVHVTASPAANFVRPAGVAKMLGRGM
jgi:hypothetical protein